MAVLDLPESVSINDEVGDDHVFCYAHRQKGTEWITNEFDDVVDVAGVGEQPLSRLLTEEPEFDVESTEGTDTEDENPTPGDDKQGSVPDIDAESAVEGLERTMNAAEAATDVGEDEDVYDVVADELGVERQEIERAVVEQMSEENDENDGTDDESDDDGDSGEEITLSDVAGTGDGYDRL